MVKVGDRKEVVSSASGIRPGSESESGKAEEAVPAKFGISIVVLPQARRDSLGFKEKGGVLIEDVVRGSFAEDIGLLENDIIVAINRQPVNSPDDVKRIQATLKPGDPVAFHIKRAAGAARGAQSGSADWRSVFVAGTMPNN